MDCDENTLPFIKSGETQKEKVPCCCSQRWILAYTGFFGFLLVYALRVNISVGIVCMVRTEVTNNTNISNVYNNTDSDNTCVLDVSGITNEVI